MWLHFKVINLWFEPTNVITSKTQLHTVNACWKHVSQLGLTDVVKTDCSKFKLQEAKDQYARNLPSILFSKVLLGFAEFLEHITYFCVEHQNRQSYHSRITFDRSRCSLFDRFFSFHLRNRINFNWVNFLDTHSIIKKFDRPSLKRQNPCNPDFIVHLSMWMALHFLEIIIRTQST